MFRALIELVITVLVVIVIRAILTSLLRSSASIFRAGAAPAAQRPPDRAADAPASGELHKDPVCGTYVAESTPFRQNISGQIFYYCSEACREKHALVAR
jgi:YHS domain-containing protein